MPTTKTLMLGSNGLLGSALSPLLADRTHLIKQSRNSHSEFYADALNLNSLQTLFSKVRPDNILNLIALADVDKCAVIQDAYLGNVQTSENIAQAIRTTELNPFLVHISTDHLYDGAGYHSEDDLHFVNNYAFSKYVAEGNFRGLNRCVLRTNFFGKSRSAKNSFSDWLFESLSNGQQIQLFNDVMFNPISIPTMADVLLDLFRLQPKGVFNLGSRNGMSKAEFGLAFAEELSLPTHLIKVVSVDQVDFLKVPRPKGMLMDVTKIEQQLGYRMPLLSDEIRRVAEEYRGD